MKRIIVLLFLVTCIGTVGVSYADTEDEPGGPIVSTKVFTDGELQNKRENSSENKNINSDSNRLNDNSNQTGLRDDLSTDSDNADSTLINEESQSFWNYQWDMQYVTDNGKSYEQYTPSKDISVGVIDSGITLDHPDLTNSLGGHLENFVPQNGFHGEEQEETGVLNYVNDKLGHGTEVVGQITANGRVKGVSPGIIVNIYRVFGDSLADPKWINRAIRKAADDGNKVISLSMGQYLLISGSYDDGTNDLETYVIYKDAIDYASEKGSIVVASLGNEGLNEQDNSQMLHYLSSFHHVKEAGIVVDAPCIFDQVVAVGGLDMYGNISDFSNFTDKAIYAPAGSTINLKKYGPTEFLNKGFYLKDWIFTTSYTGWYQYVYGNSFAAPKVASAIALIADKYHITSPEQLKQFLFKNSPTINGNKVLKLTDLLNVGNADMFLYMSIENSISNFNIYSKSSVDRSKITLQLKDVPKQLSYIITDTSIDHLNNKMLPPMGEKVGSDILLIGFLMIDLSALLIFNNLIIKYNSDKEVESAQNSYCR